MATVAEAACGLTGLVQGQVPEGQREAEPQRDLNPDQQAGSGGVTVISDVELRHKATQILPELEAEQRAAVWCWRLLVV